MAESWCGLVFKTYLKNNFFKINNYPIWNSADG